jgi:hypothetical protein
VIADEPGQKDHQLGYRADLRHYQAFGTWGYSRQKITRVVDTLHSAPSSASRLVRAADLIAFLYHRIATTRRGADTRADHVNQRLWALVEPLFSILACGGPERTRASPKGRAPGLLDTAPHKRTTSQGALPDVPLEQDRIFPRMPLVLMQRMPLVLMQQCRHVPS